MASEIRVNKIENRSGLGTVTFADTGVDLAGIVTATTFSGSGASLTNVPDSALSAVTASKLSGALPAISGANLTALNGSNIASGTVADARISTLTASKLTGALPALDGSALTGVASTENIRTNTNATFLQNVNVSGSTTTGTAVVGGGVTISESGIEASGIGITCANINGTQIGGRRNLLINGDMKIAQRGTSSTSNGMNTIDRFAVNFDSGLTEAPTQAQVTLSSSDTPYSSGFRYALKITNGNQTSQDANDYIQIAHKIEAQDVAQSGWNYISSSSNITLSFWVKASIAQTMYARLNAEDASRAFSFAFSATTSWTKITKIIPGNSNLVFNNDNGTGIALYIIPFYGTSYTTSGHTNDAWITDSGSDQVTDMANTWFSGNDATLEVTGVQLEVGSQATPFEHRSFGEELFLCQRYYYRHATGSSKGVSENGTQYNGSTIFLSIPLPTEMRAAPSLDITNSTNHFIKYANNGPVNFDTLGRDGITTKRLLCVNASASGTAGHACMVRANSADAYIAADAEL